MNGMIRFFTILALAATVGGVCTGNGWSISAEDVVRLKQAGISDATVQLIIVEKTIETAAFSIEELLAMKQAGIGEKTLRAIVRSGSQLRTREPIVYGRAVRPIRLSSVEDIIEMHRAGFSDAALEAVLAATNSGSESERQSALDLLEEMDIRIDFRGE
jgi:hypothetical protein